MSAMTTQRKTVSFGYCEISNLPNFARLIESIFAQFSGDNSVEQFVEVYNNEMHDVLEKHAPLQTKEITLRPNSPWYSNDLRVAKWDKQKAERVWRRTNLTIQRDIFKEKCRFYSKLLAQSKQEYYSRKISECGNDPKRFYGLTNRLLGKNQESSLPASVCDAFVGNIQSIRTRIQESNQTSDMKSDVLSADVRFSGWPLTDFTEASTEEVRKLLSSSPSKSCELDPIPTFLLKQCTGAIVPAITTIVNKLLCEDEVPSDFKQAIVRPLLKKLGLGKEVLKNYRPVSNLPFVSKIVEKVVAKRNEHHLDNNFLHDNLQSAYRSCHSTETTLLRVHHDIATSLDNNCCAVLVMLDLSATFDVIEHHILFRRLEDSRFSTFVD